MARIHGKEGRVLMDATGTLPGTPVALAAVTGFSIDIKMDRVDVTAFGDANKQYVQGLADYTGDISAKYDDADLTLLEAALAGDPVVLKLVPSNADPGTFFSGLAYLDASLTSSATDAPTISGTWAAAGDWTLSQAAGMSQPAGRRRER